MTKKLTMRQTNTLFKNQANDLYDKFIENAVVLYSIMFPEKCNSKDFDHALYDMIRGRLAVEFGALYNQAKGEKNVKKRCKTAGSKRAVAHANSENYSDSR